MSQFITLYVTPVIYLYLEEFQEKVLDRTTFFHSGHSNLPSHEEIEAAHRSDTTAPIPQVTAGKE